MILKIPAAVMLMAAFQYAASLKCEADHDCPKNQYCYGSTRRQCTDCVSCALYKRVVTTKPACAKTALDCGECLQGFQEDVLTYSKRLYCIPATITDSTTYDYGASSSTLPGATLSPTFWTSLCSGTIVALVILIGLLGHIWCKKKNLSTTANALSEVVVDRPPPYNSAPLLTAPPCQRQHLDETSQSVPSFSLQVEGKCEEVLAKATPFRRPREPYDTYRSVDDEDTTASESEVDYLPSAPDLQDEETIPSGWTYHDVEVPPENDIVAEDLNDSGMSLPSSHATSTVSLAGLGRSRVFNASTFSNSLQGNEWVTSNPPQQMLEALEAQPAKRARLDTSSVGSMDSDESCRSSASPSPSNIILL